MGFLEVVQKSIQDGVNIVGRYYEKVEVFYISQSGFSLRFRDEVVIIIQVGEIV